MPTGFEYDETLLKVIKENGVYGTLKELARVLEESEDDGGEWDADMLDSAADDFHALARTQLAMTGMTPEEAEPKKNS